MAGTLEEIEAFVAVVTHGSFSAAAGALEVSAPVITRRVQALEARLATQLLRRTTRRVALTDAGRAFHERVGGIPARVAEAEEVAREASARSEGQLRVIMPTFFASSGFHHALIPRFLAQHPAVHLTLLIVPEPLDHLREDFDLLVAARAPGQRLPDTSLVRRRLLRFREALFATPAYLARHGEPRHPDDLASHNCLSYPERAWRFADPESRALVEAERVVGEIWVAGASRAWGYWRAPPEANAEAFRARLAAPVPAPAPLSLINISEPTRLRRTPYAVFCL